VKETSKLNYLVVMIFVAGIFMRVFGAWSFALAHTADHGIICLMVKHILSGQELPVFFYGLPYMGAIEPYVSAGLCRVFGLSGFMINMGTALMGILLLPVVYLWGSDAAGRTGGIAALAFCVVGPEFYFQFQSWADGGYAAILLFDALILWQGVRILADAEDGDEIPVRDYIMLGLIAGLAWWLSPLTIAAFITIAILFFAQLRLRVFRWRLLYASGAFFAGSLPFWIWNFRNYWKTFDMLRSNGHPKFLMGLKMFYVDRMSVLLDLWDMPECWRRLMIVLYIGAALFCVLLVLDRMVRRKLNGKYLHLTAAVVFVLVSSVLFTRSHLALAPAVRYLLPLIPAMAVILGVTTAVLVKYLPYGTGWIPLLVIIGAHSAMLPKRNSERIECTEFAATAAQFAVFLEEKGITHIYTKYQCPWANHGLNFLLDERFVFSDLGRERYRPYASSIENADAVAVMNDLGWFSSFLDATAGSAVIGGIDGLRIHYNIRPPERGLREIEPALLDKMTAASGESLLAKLTDADVSSAVSYAEMPGKKIVITATFKYPQPISALRLLTPCGARPHSCRVMTQAFGDSEWKTIKKVRNITGYFWSGPRFYCGGDSFRVMLNFPETTVKKVRIEIAGIVENTEGELSEIQFFANAENGGGGEWKTDELVELLHKLGAKECYADRWLSNKLHADSGIGIEVLRDRDFGENRLSRRIMLTPHSVFAVETQEAPLTRRVLSDAEINMRERTVGRWTVFSFDASTWKDRYAEYPAMHWHGYAPLLRSDKEFCVYLEERAGELYRQGQKSKASALLRKALDIYPNYQAGLLLMSKWMRESGKPSLAERYEAIYRLQREPDIKTLVKFKNRIEFLGISIDRREASPGDVVKLRYYWRCPAKVDPRMLALFVHFKNGSDIVFQDDHVLLQDAITEIQPFDEIFVETRELRLPSNLPLGDYVINMGLYQRTGNHRRLKFLSKLESGGYRVFLLPVTLKISRGVDGEKDA